jgi:thioredoxin reductase
VFFAHTTEVTPEQAARLEARAIRVIEGEVTALVVEDDHLAGVRLADDRVVRRHALFIRPTNVPHPDGLLADLGCEVDGSGFPVVDPSGRTSVPGFWAAGNVVDPRLQVIASAGAGAMAAIAINADLVQEDVRSALERAVPAEADAVGIAR